MRTATLVLACIFAVLPGGERPPLADAGDSARIARIERGLLPAVSVPGRNEGGYLLADRMRSYRVPGVSVAVIDGGHLAWARAWGTLEADKEARVDTASLFQAGSISKVITAFAALRLVDRGALRLDDAVALRLRSWKLPPYEWERTRPVTLRGLLSHGAGMNVPSFPGYPIDGPVPTVLQVLQGTPPANTPPVRVETEPGTRWNYSGGGMMVVQQLIADATSRPFADVLQSQVLAPAGMAHTWAGHPMPAARAATAATGHVNGSPIAGRWRVYPEIAAAGLWSTAQDLARFGIAVIHAVRGESGALLSPATGRAMATRQIGDWGLGFALGGGAGDSLTVGHDGSTSGYTARVLVVPATGQGVAIMTNGESEPLISEIVRAVAREYHWPVRPRIEKSVAAIDSAAWTGLGGRYRVVVGDRNFDFTVAIEGIGVSRRLIITGPSGRPAELLPLSPTRFFSQDTGNEFTFVREADGVASMQIDQQGQRFTARRLP